MMAMWDWLVEGLPWTIMPVVIWLLMLVALPLWIMEIIAHRHDKKYLLLHLSPLLAIAVGATSMAILTGVYSGDGILLPMILALMSLFAGGGIFGIWGLAAKGVIRRLKARKR